jgi:hypothetical protein
LAVADIRAGFIGDSDSPVTGIDASTVAATLAPRIHFNSFSSRCAAKFRFAQTTPALINHSPNDCSRVMS